MHPNVVQILDAVPDPVAPYLVMEYVGGSTLRPFCRADQLLPLELIVEIGFKCAMALGYMYRQGLIHRDVKPANLLTVMTNGAITDVKITDFGSVLNLASDVTQIYRVGSLAYMSPEQLDGSTLDCRADIYSLGAVLYHLIAGRPPVRRAGAVGHDASDLQRPSRASLTGLRSGLAAGVVDDVIQIALAKNPHERFGTWDEFAQALSQLIVTTQQVPRGQLQGVLDSERFNLLRSLDFFTSFGDVELWEVVHRAKVAALQLRPCDVPQGRGRPHLSHHLAGRGRGVPRRQEGGQAGRRHLGRRDGLLAPAPSCGATAPT